MAKVKTDIRMQTNRKLIVNSVNNYSMKQKVW